MIMPTYQEYQEQIAKLQSLAEQACQDEIAEARKQVRELMQKHHLRLGDLSAKTKKRHRLKRAAPSRQSIVTPIPGKHGQDGDVLRFGWTDAIKTTSSSSNDSLTLK